MALVESFAPSVRLNIPSQLVLFDIYNHETDVNVLQQVSKRAYGCQRLASSDFAP